MKTCKKCGETKDESQFSIMREHVDGLRDDCKACCAAYMANRLRNKIVSQPVPSTARAMELLQAHGIPCQTGYQAGMPYVDIVAYGCIPIEAKASKATVYGGGGESYHFGFTKAQVQRKPEGFVILIANGARERVFVLRAGQLEFSGQKFCVTLDAVCRFSEHAVRMVDLLERNEDAFYLVDQAILDKIRTKNERSNQNIIAFDNTPYQYQSVIKQHKAIKQSQMSFDFTSTLS